MNSGKIAFIVRAARYSPGATDKDLAILTAVRQQLAGDGFVCLAPVSEEHLPDLPEADAYVSMARSQPVLDLLAARQAAGRLVVNGVPAVMLCGYRSLLMHTLQHEGVSVPPTHGDGSYWVKRGFGWRETASDVQQVPDYSAAVALRDSLLAGGAAAVDVRRHVEGDWVKFYAVRQTAFFYTCHPAGQRYAFSADALRQMTARAAACVSGLDVYGGDCIVRPDGEAVLVDLNDWPSFSPCRAQAARAIAEHIRGRMS